MEHRIDMGSSDIEVEVVQSDVQAYVDIINNPYWKRRICKSEDLCRRYAYLVFGRRR